MDVVPPLVPVDSVVVTFTAPIVENPTYYGGVIKISAVDNPDDYNALLPTDKVLVIGEKVGEFITYGDVKEKQWSDMNPTPPQWLLEIYQQFGMIIDNAQGIYVIGGLS